jgi:tetratricopeptide (TPR) repeat protein
VIIRLALDKLTTRLAFLLVSLPLVVLLVWLIISHFIIGEMADTRAEVAPDVLAAAAGYFPASPLLQARLAEAELADAVSPEEAAASAEAHAAQAVRLSPQDYRNHLLLASALEARGETAAALEALRTAVRLAPKYTEVHWQLANLLLRSDQVEQSLAEFRTAVALDRSRLKPTLDLIFNTTEGDICSLEMVAGDGMTERLGLAQFLLDHELADDAVRVFRSVNHQTQLSSPETGQFLSALIARNRYELAYALWSALVSPERQLPLIWNGGFETDVSSSLGQFDWSLKESEYAWTGISSGEGRGGSRALRIDFAGRDTTRLSDEIRQMVLVRPGLRYRLECYAKAAALETPEGPRVVVSSGNAELAASQPVAAGDQDWLLLTTEFTAPKDAPVVFVNIRRTPKFSYDAPTRGTVWFDDFKLTPLEPGAAIPERQ